MQCKRQKLSTPFGGRVSRENISPDRQRKAKQPFSSWWFLASTQNKIFYREGMDQSQPQIGEIRGTLFEIYSFYPQKLPKQSWFFSG